RDASFIVLNGASPSVSIRLLIFSILPPFLRASRPIPLFNSSHFVLVPCSPFSLITIVFFASWVRMVHQTSSFQNS
ncbi:MAG: hypothetical protein IKR07_04365, partial [Oscillospiraceae bacterium]|nr:hypothetical protein [Oscillospiraceae bacterium]